jgi:hypothetical protein
LAERAGNQDKRAEEAGKKEVKKDDKQVSDARARFLARKATRSAAATK